MLTIQELIDRCKGQIRNVQYFGEVILTRAEMQSVASVILNHSNTLIPKEDEDLLATVLAVNCMCYEYDDYGFWYHFEKLCGRPLEQKDKNYWGTIFEDILEKDGFIESRRFGPFRYVGLLLEQSGLPFFYIPHFIRMLKELGDTPGWQVIITGPNRLISNYISVRHLPKYLKDFLLDNSGVIFTRHVVKLVYLYSEGVLSQSDILQLAGFRPEFWQQVFALLQAPKKNAKLLANPYITLNVLDYRIGLVLPSPAYTIDGIQNCPLQFPVTWFTCTEHLLEMYSGRIKGHRQVWAIPGFTLSEPVLFDSGGRVVSKTVVKPGEYYLVSAEESIPITECNFLGKVRLGSTDSRYNVYRIHLFVNDKLGLIRVMRLPELEVSAGETIPWDTGAIRVIVNTDANVVRVVNPELVNEGKIGLFLDAGSGVTRIKYSSQLSNTLRGITLPTEIRIWCEVLGRTRHMPWENISELHIRIFPRFHIDFEDRSYNFFETPLISVDGKGIEVHFFEADAVDQNKYKIWQGIKQVSGRLGTGSIKTNFSFPIKRHGLIINESEVRSYLVAQDLSGETIGIAGEAGANIGLGFIDGYNEFIGIIGDNNYETVKTEVLVKLASAAPLPIMELYAFINDIALPLGTKIIDVYRLDNFHSIDMASCSVEKIINLCYELRKGNSPGCSLSDIPKVSPSLDNWLYINFLCAWLFDSVRVLVAGEVIHWENLLSSEYDKAVAIWSNSTVDFWPVLTDLLPPPGRWRDIYIKRANWSLVEYRKSAYIEWREEVLSASTRKWKSAIAQLNSGSDLCSAWALYLRDEFTMATERLRYVNESHRIIHDLKGILSTLIYLRTGRFTAAYKASQVRKMDDFEITFTALYKFAGILCGKQSELPQSPADEVDMLPLPMQDIVLFTGLDSLSEESQQDWLLVVLSLYTSLKKGLPPPCSESNVVSSLRNMPASPERQSLIEQIRKWRGLYNE